MDNNKNCKKEVPPTFVGMSIFGGISLIMAIAYGQVVVGILIAIILVAIGYVIDKPVLDANREISEAEKKAAQEKDDRQRREAKFREIYTSGEWKFPEEMFYIRCKENGISDMDSSFYSQKAHLLATALLNEAGIPAEFHSLYISDEKLKEIYTYWHGVEEDKKKKQQELYERKTREPQRANLSADERATIFAAEQLKKEYGRNKRYVMLTNEINTILEAIKALDEEIAKAESFRNSSWQTTKSMIEANTKINNVSKQSWGLAGGIADAIAGPGAGVVAAADTMRRNAAIDQKTSMENKRYTELSVGVEIRSLEHQVKLERKKDQLNRQLKDLESERIACMQKVVLEDVSTDEIKKHITPRVISISRNKSDALEVSVKIKNGYIPQVPSNAKIVVDGLLSVDVFSDKICVGTAYIPFPIYGIPCGETTDITALCPYYLEGDHKYTLKYKYHNLWVMEQ